MNKNASNLFHIKLYCIFPKVFTQENAQQTRHSKISESKVLKQNIQHKKTPAAWQEALVGVINW